MFGHIRADLFKVPAVTVEIVERFCLARSWLALHFLIDLLRG